MSKRNHVATLDEGSLAGWTRAFERELRKLNPIMCYNLNPAIAKNFYMSATYTPFRAAATFKAMKDREAYEHGQLNRPIKG